VEVSAATGGTFDRGDEARFTGEVYLRGTLRDDTGTNIGVVHFSPGARTHWHHHPGGQFLYVLSGRGRVRSRGATGHALEPGDVIHAGVGEWHFHGAAPDAPLMHVAINGGGDAIWGDPVSDTDYGEGFLGDSPASHRTARTGRRTVCRRSCTPTNGGSMTGGVFTTTIQAPPERVCLPKMKGFPLVVKPGIRKRLGMLKATIEDDG